MIKKLESHFGCVLIISAIIVSLVCVWIGSMQSVWFDEAYSILIAKQSFANLIHLTAVDTHPPLFYIVLKCWATIFGWCELSLRSFSALSAGLSVLFAGLIAKKLFDKKTSLIILPFLVFAPFILRYGFEIRMYSFAALVGIAATYLLVLADRQTNRQKIIKYYVLYAILVAVGMMTLYYTAFLWLAHVAWLAWNTCRDKKPILKSQWVKAYILSVILFLPWLPTFVSQFMNGALAPISQSMTIDNLVGVASFWFLYRPVWQLGALLSLITVLLLAAIIFLSIRVYKLSSKSEKRGLTLLLLYFAVPIAILTMIGLVKPMYVERYLAHVAIGGMMYVGACVAILINRHDKYIKPLAVFILAVMACGIVRLVGVGNFNFQRLQSPEIKSAAKSMPCGDKKVAFAAGPYEAIELSYYLPNCPIYFYSDTAKLGGGYAILSESKLRVIKPETELSDNDTIFYAHYGQAKLNMPANMKLTSSNQFDKLVVDRYGVK